MSEVAEIFITDEENDNAPFYAIFSDAKVENLSNNAITMDKVGLEGSISNNEVEIISIDMEKNWSTKRFRFILIFR